MKLFYMLMFMYACVPHTQIYSSSKAATIKKTKQRKRSEINHCKISQTQQDNTIITRPDIQHTVDK